MDKLNCLIDGPKDAPLMFFIHGWPDSPSLWQKQITEFSKDYRCIRIELPNYGDKVAKFFYNFSELADLMIATIEGYLADSKWEDVILVGHDWGAFFAYQVEAKRPDLVSRFITMDIGTYLKPESLFQALAIITYQWSLVVAFYIGRIIPVVGDFVSRVVGIVVGAPKKSRPRWQMNYLYVSYWSDFFRGKSNYSVSLPSKPLLYLYGQKKPFMFHTQEWLASIQADPKNEVIAMHDCGHWLMLNAPDRVNELIRKWL